MRIGAVLVLAFALAGCSYSQAIHPQDVIANPAAKEGQRVFIRGYLVYGTDARGLWQSQQAYRDFTPQAPLACLTLFNASRFARELDDRAGSTVTLTARVRTLRREPDAITFGWCNDTGLMIEKVE